MADNTQAALPLPDIAFALRTEGDVRRNALISAMVRPVSPMAGVVLAVRSADAVNALIAERDAAIARVPAPVPAAGGPPAATGQPAADGRTAPSTAVQAPTADRLVAKEDVRQLVSLLERGLTAMTELANAVREELDERKKAASAPESAPVAQTGSGDGKTSGPA